MGSAVWGRLGFVLFCVLFFLPDSSSSSISLSIQSQPNVGFVDTILSPPFVVSILDGGVQAAGDYNCSAVDLLEDGYSTWGLGGSTNVSASSGIATFDGLTVGNTGGNMSIAFQCRDESSLWNVHSSIFGIIREATADSVTSLSLSHVLKGVPIMLQMGGAPFSPLSFAGVAKAGECDTNRVAVMALKSGTGNQSGYVLLPALNETGAYKICLTSGGASGTFLEQQWVHLYVTTITGVTPSSVIILGKRDIEVQLTCNGNCYGPHVRVGLMPLESCDCTSILGGQSFAYDDDQHNGQDPARLPFAVNDTGTYRICWSPDDGETFFSQGHGFRAIADASPSSITMFYPYFATKLIASTLTFSGAQHSSMTYLGFAPTSAGSCSAPSFKHPVTCTGSNCSDAAATLSLNIAYTVPEGQYLVCYSVSGVNGTYALQEHLPYNFTVYERQCPAFMCEPGEFYVTAEDAPFGGSCMRCPAGSYSLSGQGDCTTCPAGFECSNPGVPPVRCFLGSYSEAGDINCTLCPSGMSCPSPDMLPQSCGPGEYSDVGQANCSQCAPGYYSVHMSWGDDTSNCSFSASRGASNCTRCPSGHSCEPDGLPVECPAGTSSSGGQLSCTACDPGYYSFASSSSCMRCPAGSSCAYADQSPTPCQAGFFSDAGQDNCTACSPGTFSGCNRSACISCPPGTSCPGNATTEPTPCLAGSFSGPGAAECSPCPAGLYSESGAGECSPCPQGHHCDMGLSPQPCPPGAFAPQNSTECFECPGGHFSNTSSAGICFACPAGFRCPRASSGPIPCDPGSFASGASSNCTLCSNGSYAPEEGMADCLLCPAGYICPTGSSFKIQCEAGRYAAAGSAECLPCADGRWSDFGSQQCLSCPPSSYCPAGIGPYPCPHGTYSPGKYSRSKFSKLEFRPSGTHVKQPPLCPKYFPFFDFLIICLVVCLIIQQSPPAPPLQAILVHAQSVPTVPTAQLILHRHLFVLPEHFVLRHQHPLRIVPKDTFPGTLQT